MKLFKELSQQRECEITKFYVKCSLFYVQFSDNHASLNMKLIFAVYNISENAGKVNSCRFYVEFNDFSKVFFYVEASFEAK